MKLAAQPTPTPAQSAVRVPEEFSREKFFETLNRIAEGQLNNLLEQLGKAAPPPPNYAKFQQGQRKRLGVTRVREQYNWAWVKSERVLKPGSKIGQVIMKYLDLAEQAVDPNHAEKLAGHIQDRLGATVAKHIEREFERNQTQAPDFGIS